MGLLNLLLALPLVVGLSITTHHFFSFLVKHHWSRDKALKFAVALGLVLAGVVGSPFVFGFTPVLRLVSGALYLVFLVIGGLKVLNFARRVRKAEQAVEHVVHDAVTAAKSAWVEGQDGHANKPQIAEASATAPVLPPSVNPSAAPQDAPAASPAVGQDKQPGRPRTDPTARAITVKEPGASR